MLVIVDPRMTDREAMQAFWFIERFHRPRPLLVTVADARLIMGRDIVPRPTSEES